MKPSVGRIVHYVTSAFDGTVGDAAGEHRPAIVVKRGQGGWLNLQVFTDGSNERTEKANIMWVGSVTQDEEEKRPGTWHWPEREEG